MACDVGELLQFRVGSGQVLIGTLQLFIAFFQFSEKIAKLILMTPGAEGR